MQANDLANIYCKMHHQISIKGFIHSMQCMGLHDKTRNIQISGTDKKKVKRLCLLVHFSTKYNFLPICKRVKMYFARKINQIWTGNHGKFSVI